MRSVHTAMARLMLAACMSSTVACGYLDADLTLDDEEFEESVASGPQLYELESMHLFGIGHRGAWGYSVGGRRLPPTMSSPRVIFEADTPSGALGPQGIITRADEELAWLEYEREEFERAAPKSHALVEYATGGAQYALERDAERKAALERAFSPSLDTP